MCIFAISNVLGLSVLASIWTVLDYIHVCNFWKCPFYSVIMPIFLTRTLISLRIFFGDSPQCKVRQRTKKDVAASRAMIMNRHVIPEGNVVRADIMVAPLNGIHEII
jgi:hypothetical protein